MLELIEAQAINLSYQKINEFAQRVEKTQIASLPSVNNAINLMGGKITEISLTDWENKKFPFVIVNDQNDFEIFICETFPQEMKRFLILQALGHYILHSESGLQPCQISSVAKSAASREGIIFALSLLVPDELAKQLIARGTSNIEIANYFNVLPQMVVLKKKFMNQLN